MTWSHTFHTRILLPPGRSAEDWQEVTAAQRAKLEAEDEAWTRPPQAFIDRWVLAGTYVPAGATKTSSYSDYNEETRFFELNGLGNITYAEAQVILELYYYFISDKTQLPKLGTTRTLLPIVNGLFGQTNIDSAFKGFKATALRFLCDTNWRPFSVKSAVEAFRDCKNLEVIYGGFTFAYATNVKDMFLGCAKLREVYLTNLHMDFSLESCPLISEESIRHLITNRYTTNAFTLTLHAEAYARMPDDVFDMAAEKNITIAST